MLDAVLAGNNLDVNEFCSYRSMRDSSQTIEDDESDTMDEEEENVIGSLATLEDTIPDSEEIRKIGTEMWEVAAAGD